MANFKFFNIGKANEEITRLEGEVTKAQADAKAATENAAEVEKAAETATADLSQARADLATAKTSITSLTSRAEKAEADLKTANEKIANPSEEIKNRASKEALKITGAQGQPPLESKPGAETQNGDILAQYAAIKDSTEKTVFYRKNKAVYDAAHKKAHANSPL